MEKGSTHFYDARQQRKKLWVNGHRHHFFRRRRRHSCHRRRVPPLSYHYHNCHLPYPATTYTNAITFLPPPLPPSPPRPSTPVSSWPPLPPLPPPPPPDHLRHHLGTTTRASVPFVEISAVSGQLKQLERAMRTQEKRTCDAATHTYAHVCVVYELHARK